MNYRQLAAIMMNQLALHPELGDMKVNICVGKDDYRDILKLESVYKFGVENGTAKMTGVELAFYPEGVCG
jgi:hypothetical protein